MEGIERTLSVGSVELTYLSWPGERAPFVLLHGLSSNARTWQMVAARLAAAGHPVVAVDQRGHGRSSKPEDGYDFDTVTGDLERLLERLAVERPILVGQSWGGNVVLHFGARFPGRARGLGFVDGGFLDLQADSATRWEQVAERLRPPDVSGTPREQLRAYMRQAHPDWEEQGIEATLENFEPLGDGTVQRRLPIPLHMKILRALWEQRPPELYPRVREPVLIAVAENEGGPPGRHDLVAAAERALARVAVQRFPATDHDIHIHRPAALADLFLSALAGGIWSEPV